MCKETLKHHLSIKYIKICISGSLKHRFNQGRVKYFREIVCLIARDTINYFHPMTNGLSMPNSAFPWTFSWRFIFRHVLRLSFHTCFPWRSWLALLCVCVAIFMMLKIWSIIMTVFGDWRFSSLPLSLCLRETISLGLPLAAGATNAASSSHTIKTRALRRKLLFGKMIQERRMFRNDRRQRVVGIVLQYRCEDFFFFFHSQVRVATLKQAVLTLSDAYWERNLFDREMKNFCQIPTANDLADAGWRWMTSKFNLT